MSTSWVENRPQEIVEQWRTPTLLTRTIVDAVQNTWYNVTDGVRFVLSDARLIGVATELDIANEDIEIEFTLDGVVYAGAIAPHVAGAANSRFWFRNDRADALESDTVQTLAGNLVPWNCHSVSMRIRKTSNNSALTDIVVDVRYEQL